jgi:hypothetical protein
MKPISHQLIRTHRLRRTFLAVLADFFAAALMTHGGSPSLQPLVEPAATSLLAPVTWKPLISSNILTTPFDYVDFDVKLSEKPQKYYRVRQP